MPVHLVLTVIARDKPGIVEALSHEISRHDANWLGSRMARLAGEFAGIVEVSAPDASAEALRQALAGLGEKGLRVHVHESSLSEEQGFARILLLELVGHDRPGIVREIAQALARRGVNVDELSTGCESAPMSGETLFRAKARLTLPADVRPESLAEELEKLAGHLMVDLTLEDPS
jgi:glycine cleavage system regulatory protein